MADFWEMIRTYEQHRNALHQQEAIFGYHAPTHIQIEREKYDKVLDDHHVKLLLTHERNLQQYLQQLALIGDAQVPPMIVNGIRECRRNIAQRREYAYTSVGFTFDLVPGVDTEDQYVPVNAPPPVMKNRVGQVLTAYIGGQPYSGKCVYEDEGKTRITWEYDGFSFSVMAESSKFQ